MTQPVLGRAEEKRTVPASTLLRSSATHVSFALIFALLSPLYYANLWHFKRITKRRPFASSKLVSLIDRFPLFYELAMIAINFPVRQGVYLPLPRLSGKVLQVGCGTGLLNKYLKDRQNIDFANMDPNRRSLQLGMRLGRYTSCINAYIDKRTNLEDASFDIVLFARSFHHVRNHKRALAECARLLKSGGRVIIADPVALKARDQGIGTQGYMVNSSIDGVIWRFTPETFGEHIRACLPENLTFTSLAISRPFHVSNYNFIEPQADAVAVLTRS